MPRKILYILSLALLPGLLLNACTAAPPADSSQPRLLATTNIIADVVRQVAGEQAVLDVLIPTGSDPHAFSPAPQDAALVSQADILFLNGLGLESALQPVLNNARPDALVVDLSSGIPVLQSAPAAEESEHDSHAAATDPHVWTSPQNVRAWLPLIAGALAQKDPAHASLYHQRADEYAAQLEALDAWVAEQVAAIPPERRILVSDHLVWGYFARRYAFTQQAALIPGFSTLAQPSARDLAALEDSLRQMDVPAIFVGTTINPSLAEQVAADTGVRLVFLYTGSLSAPDGPAATYLDWMRYNVRAIVEALQ